MANRRIEVDIVANDRASSVFSNVRANAASFSTSLMSALNGTANAVDNFNNTLRHYNNAMWGFNRVASNVVKAAGDSIYNFTKDAINNFSELEQQHAKTMGAMATEYDKTAEAQRRFLEDSQKLKQQSLTLGTVGPSGKGSLNSVLDVSSAQTSLVKAGMSADDLLNTNVIESILKFAGGNDLDIDTATQFAVNLGTVFDKPVAEWGKMLDQVTKAADISVIDVEDIMDSLTYTGGIAAGLDRDLSEVLGVISVMGQAGLRGRVAGTGMQAFFTRILSGGELSDTQIGNAPTEYVGQMYNAFIAESTNSDGTFKDMDEIAATLNTAMGSLTDQEQAWFAKKLFGLYQMKAAYAISGAADGDTNMITDYINQIENESAGTNDAKYELMLASQYGKLESLRNAYEGIKTDFGDRLSPVVSTIADELFSFLSDPQNYKIDWNNLREALSESGDLIAERYGEKLGEIVEDIGNFGIDAGLITEALLPQAGGILSGIVKLMNGDISGALDDFSEGLRDTNDNIDELPPELQGTATAARNVITAFTTLAGINLGTQILQIITTAFDTFIGKPIKWAIGKITSTSTTVTSTSSAVNATTATVNIGSVPLMNVTATVVNVYGGFGNPGTGNPGTGTPQLPGGGSPSLLPGGGTPLLPGAAGKLLLGAGATGTAVAIMPSVLKMLYEKFGITKLLGGGTGIGGLLGGNTVTTPLLPGMSAGVGGAATTGKVVTMYNVGGSYMTAAQAAKVIASKAALGGLAGLGSIAAIDLFGSPGLLKSNDKRVQEGSDWLDRYIQEGNTNYKDIAGNARVYDWIRNNSNYNGSNSTEVVKNEITGRTAARSEMMTYYKSGAGADVLSQLFAAQIEQYGKITEEFLTSITQWTKDGYTYTGSNDDIKEILDFMYSNFSTDYKDSWNWSGRFNDTAVNKFVKGNNQLNTFDSITTQTILDTTQGVINASQDVIDAVNDAMDKVRSPKININIETNVDKNGDVTTDAHVDVDGISRDLSRRASQYGTQSYVIN